MSLATYRSLSNLPHGTFFPPSVWTNGAQDKAKPKPQVKPGLKRKQSEDNESKQAGGGKHEDDEVSEDHSPAQDVSKKCKKRSSTKTDDNSDVEESEVSDQPAMKKTKKGTKTKRT